MKRTLLFLALLLIVGISPVFAQEGCYSYFNYFHDEPILNGYMSDGFHFNGPFRVNGSMVLFSESSGRNNDPYFYSLTLSSDYYIYGPSSAGPQVTVPQYENLWIEPYEQMEQGAPWFNLGADLLPFGADEIDWQIVRAAAQNYGLYLTAAEVPDGSRILLENSQLTVRIDQSSAPVVYSLDELTEPVIWVENAATDVLYLKSHPDSPGFSEELTIGCYGDIYFSGPLEYSAGAPGMLGLISVYGDGVIADTPTSDWDAPFEVETEESFVYSASLLLLEGDFKAENPMEPNPVVDFTLLGGIQLRAEGFTSTANSGFILTFEYDTRLFNQAPPWYPEYQTSGFEAESYENNSLELVASANPFSSSVLFTITLPSTISIIDSAGRVVHVTETEGQYIFNGSALPEGLYVVVATDMNGNRASLKLIKF